MDEQTIRQTTEREKTKTKAVLEREVAAKEKGTGSKAGAKKTSKPVAKKTVKKVAKKVVKPKAETVARERGGTVKRKDPELIERTDAETEGQQGARTEGQTEGKKKERKKPVKPDIPKLLEMAERNPRMTNSELAATQNLEKSTVQKVLERYGIIKQEVDDYVEHRVEILQGLQQRILKSISEDDLKKAPLNTKLMAYGVAYDKERLEKGQSTANITTITAVVDAAKARREQILKGKAQESKATHTEECVTVDAEYSET